MARDDERIERIKSALHEANLDAIVCALPTNVLLLSGYYPIVGTAVALATRDGEVAIITPEDERELAERGWADKVRVFKPSTLNEIKTAADAVHDSLRDAAKDLGLKRGRIGYETGQGSEPASYAAMNLYGARILDLLEGAIPSISLEPADELLAHLRAVKTPCEIERIRAACRTAEQAFLRGARVLRPKMKETEAAMMFRAPLGMVHKGEEGIERADGFAFCMSGANSAQAHGAYARSRLKEIEVNEFVLIHCNSHADGFWTDITRTYCLSYADERKREMYEAVFAARRAAIDTIHPGARAADVDRAARAELTARGFGEAFKHATGHEVGFAAIDHNARPRLHPASTDMLETGMTFNVEPGIYIDGYGGLRHCDMVAVTARGAEILTPFHSSIEDLIIAQSASAA